MKKAFCHLAIFLLVEHQQINGIHLNNEYRPPKEPLPQQKPQHVIQFLDIDEETTKQSIREAER